MQIHHKQLTVPVLQGGMGVGVSLEKLAGTVALNGGMGTISTADCGYREADFREAPERANLRALRREIKDALSISRGKGLVAVNAMVATRQYNDAVKKAIDAGVDAIVSGAGLPLNLPELVPEGAALIAPIVSGPRALGLICKVWFKRYHRYPDFIVLESSRAGGHLGFSRQNLISGTCASLKDLIKSLLAPIRDLEQKAGRHIPLFAAGGIWSRRDAEEALSFGASGVQLATRFIATKECDASDSYKSYLLRASKDDLTIIESPVGMPGRAITSPLLTHLKDEGRIAPVRCSRCIKTCDPSRVPYCITDALIAAVKGDLENGLFFSGDNIDKLDRIETVEAILNEFRGLPVPL